MIGRLAPILRASGVLFAALSLQIPAGAAKYKAPPGRYTTSSVGNSYPGDGGPNGFGYRVQNGADGKVNRVLLKQQVKKETASGWTAGNEAIAVAAPTGEL